MGSTGGEFPANVMDKGTLEFAIVGIAITSYVVFSGNDTGPPASDDHDELDGVRFVGDAGCGADTGVTECRMYDSAGWW
jgi:hypothetical protein